MFASAANTPLAPALYVGAAPGSRLQPARCLKYIPPASLPRAQTRFTHNPAKGSLTTETDRLYLWTLVLALEYEDTYTFTPNLPPQDETGFMKLLREAVFVNSQTSPKEAAAEIATRDAQMHADAAAAAATAGTAVPEGRGGAVGRTGGGEGGEEAKEEGGGGRYEGVCTGSSRGLGGVDSTVEAGHREGGDGVSGSGRGSPTRGGSESDDQAYRDDETIGDADEARSGVLGPSVGDVGGGNRAEGGAGLVERTGADSGGGSSRGDIETGAETGGDDL